MPLRTFPFPLRVGTDLCKISRIKDLLARAVKQSDNDTELQAFQRFTKRFMTLRERKYFNQIYLEPNRYSADDVIKSRWFHYLAGRWAAKEACIKAVKPRRITSSEIEVWPDQYEGVYAVILDQSRVEDAVSESQNEASDTASDQHESPNLENRRNPETGRDWPRGAELIPSNEDINGQVVRLSISHDGEYACAVALAVTDRGSNDTGGEAAAREPNG